MLREEFRRKDIDFLTLNYVLERIINNDIDEWGERRKRKGSSTTKQIGLPGSWWLLKLVEFLISAGFIKRQNIS
jgi:hypothetical protein